MEVSTFPVDWQPTQSRTRNNIHVFITNPFVLLCLIIQERIQSILLSWIQDFQQSCQIPLQSFCEKREKFWTFDIISGNFVKMVPVDLSKQSKMSVFFDLFCHFIFLSNKIKFSSSPPSLEGAGWIPLQSHYCYPTLLSARCQRSHKFFSK